MKLQDRISAFSALGNRLRSLDSSTRQSLQQRAAAQNPWFTPASVDMAIAGVASLLDHHALVEWTSEVQEPAEPKDVGVIMAGNIPMVGFHDTLSVLISGHKLLLKYSTQDSVLMQYLVDELLSIAPSFRERIVPVERLNHAQAVIATGGDNTARYFEYYFSKIPHIIRKNRSSCAILTGNETTVELTMLGLDVFSYFGLGCRNVSKLFVPEGYSFIPLLDSWSGYHDIANHHKYANNYDYNKAIMLVNGARFLDNGFVLLAPSSSLVSPISVVYYEEYKGPEDLNRLLTASKDKIQCVVSGGNDAQVKFGRAQFPGLKDYADQVNTLAFLKTI